MSKISEGEVVFVQDENSHWYMVHPDNLLRFDEIIYVEGYDEFDQNEEEFDAITERCESPGRYVVKVVGDAPRR